VKQALADAGLSAAAAARKMPGKPGGKLIYRWINAEVTAPLDRLADFCEAVERPITIRLGHNEEAAPGVSERLNKIDMYLRAIATAAGVPIAELEKIEESHRLVQGIAPGRRRSGATRP
jgi:hypothetical protein